MGTIYRVWVSTGAEVGVPNMFQVFGAVERDGEVDGTRFESEPWEGGDGVGLLDGLDALDAAVGSVMRVVERHVGRRLGWRQPDHYEADGFGGWNVWEVRVP